MSDDIQREVIVVQQEPQDILVIQTAPPDVLLVETEVAPEVVEIVAQGPQGPAATVEVGNVEVVATDADPYVTNTGTSTKAVLDFGIPRGIVGPQGPEGPGWPVDIRRWVFPSSTEWVINHNIGTERFFEKVYDASGRRVWTHVETVDANTIVVHFPVPVAGYIDVFFDVVGTAAFDYTRSGVVEQGYTG